MNNNEFNWHYEVEETADEGTRLFKLIVVKGEEKQVLRYLKHTMQVESLIYFIGEDEKHFHYQFDVDALQVEMFHRTLLEKQIIDLNEIQ